MPTHAGGDHKFSAFGKNLTALNVLISVVCKMYHSVSECMLLIS